MALTELFFVYAAGGAIYSLLELLWRGWTHWTMALCGGACFALMYLISAMDIPRHRKWLLSAAAITTVEFFTGCLVNLRLGMDIWDYSAERGNVLGQICPRFILLWLLLSVPGTALCAYIRKYMSN